MKLKLPNLLKPFGTIIQIIDPFSPQSHLGSFLYFNVKTLKLHTIFFMNVQDFGMVCEDSHLRAIFNSLFTFGRLLGSLFFGFLSDRFGRVKAISLAIMFVSAAGITEAFAQDLTTLVFTRIFYGMGSNGCMIVALVLAAESTLPLHIVKA